MSENDNLNETYEIDECVEWILKNNFRSTCLQFSEECLKDSSAIALVLKKRTDSEFYITYSTICSIDYLSIQHLNQTTVDSIIFFGKICLKQSKFTESLPILFVFGQNFDEQSLDFIETSIAEKEVKNAVILYDTYNALIALQFYRKLQSNGSKENISIAKLHLLSDKWNFTNSAQDIIQKSTKNSESDEILGPFCLPNVLTSYDQFIYLGRNAPLELKLNCSVLLEIDVTNRSQRTIYSHKELTKRVALIEKFKQNECKNVGIVFTNPVPNNVNEFFAESKKLCKRMKKKTYFLSLMLQIDEYKLGNFAELNSFVLVNSCFCSSALQSIQYYLPVINWTEFKIASGLPIKYGGVEWNQNDDQELSDSEDKQIEDLNNQLIQTEVFDKSKWFGLEVNAGDREASVVESGQKGIASAYDNETIF